MKSVKIDINMPRNAQSLLTDGPVNPDISVFEQINANQGTIIN